jgi:hypothetical protein
MAAFRVQIVTVLKVPILRCAIVCCLRLALRALDDGVGRLKADRSGVALRHGNTLARR